MKTKIGLQLYSIRSAVDVDFFGALRKVKDAGYDCVEFAGFGGYDAGFIKNEMQKIGLEPFSAHFGFEQLENDIENVVTFALELGLSWVVCPGFPITDANDCDKISSILANAALKLNPYGINVAYHNHSRELEKIDGEYIFDRIIRNNLGAKVFAEVDTFWVKYADVQPVEYIKSLGSLAGPFHFKDLPAGYKQISNHELGVEVGDGIIDFPAIIDVLKENDVLKNGIIVEQEYFEGDMFESIKISLENIKKMLL